MTIKGRKKLMRQLERMPREVSREAHKALSLNADEHVGHVKQIMPVKTGGLRRSVKKYFRKGPLSVQVEYGDDEHFYGRFVEFGTKPGVKGTRVARRSKKGKSRSRKVKRTHPGTRAQPIFYPIYRAYKKRYKGRLARALTKGIKKSQR